MKQTIAVVLTVAAAHLGIAHAQSQTPAPAPGLSVGEQGPATAPGGPAQHRHHGPRDRGHAMMQRIDLDRDGMISRAELDAAHQRQLQAFDAADTNKDGVLSREEIQQFRQQMHGQKPRS
jgi:EF hand